MKGIKGFQGNLDVRHLDQCAREEAGRFQALQVQSDQLDMVGIVLGQTGRSHRPVDALEAAEVPFGLAEQQQ
jgi:hypothetical protein